MIKYFLIFTIWITKILTFHVYNFTSIWIPFINEKFLKCAVPSIYKCNYDVLQSAAIT